MKKIALIIFVALFVSSIVYILTADNSEAPVVDSELGEVTEGDEAAAYLQSLKDKLIGRWIYLENDDSTAFSFVFFENNNYIEVYEGAEVGNGRWEVIERRGEFDVTFHLAMTNDEGFEEYEILLVDESSLTLMHPERGLSEYLLDN